MGPMKAQLLADLDARLARHAGGDSAGVLDDHALAVVELLTTGTPDAGSLARVAALHLARYEALPPPLGVVDLRVARSIYTSLHTVDPRLVPWKVRVFLGLASPHESGVARLREYEQTGRLDQLERAISLFRQELLEHEDAAETRANLATALRRRFEHTGHRTDLDESIRLERPPAEP